MSLKLVLDFLTFFLMCLISACGSSGSSSDTDDPSDSLVSGTILSYGGEPIDKSKPLARLISTV